MYSKKNVSIPGAKLSLSTGELAQQEFFLTVVNLLLRVHWWGETTNISVGPRFFVLGCVTAQGGGGRVGHCCWSVRYSVPALKHGEARGWRVKKRSLRFIDFTHLPGIYFFCIINRQLRHSIQHYSTCSFDAHYDIRYRVTARKGAPSGAVKTRNALYLATR